VRLYYLGYAFFSITVFHYRQQRTPTLFSPLHHLPFCAPKPAFRCELPFQPLQLPEWWGMLCGRQRPSMIGPATVESLPPTYRDQNAKTCEKILCVTNTTNTRRCRERCGSALEQAKGACSRGVTSASHTKCSGKTR
jgi:hypothetical protein